MATDGPIFHFYTLLTKDDQYARMRSSLAEMGFDETNSVFTVLDNREGNAHEPYSAIGKAVREAETPYIVFCHQDLVFQKGPEELLHALRDLDERDPAWAVAGNAGGTSGCETVFCVDDHSGHLDKGPRPSRVLTLDENFLIVRRDSGIACSPEISGFHLYGTDLCLNAYRQGRSAYVIEYRLTHLSSTLDYGGLLRQAREFVKVWHPRIGGAVILTSAMVMVLTPFPPLTAALTRGAVSSRLWHRSDLLRRIDRLLGPWRPKWLPRL